MNRDRKAISRRLAGFLGLAALVGGTALLGPAARADEDADPAASQPGRAVRLSLVEGEVHLYQGGQAVTDQVVANTPLFEGARIETGNDGRAEVQFEDGSVARLSPESSLTLSVLRGLSASEERNALVVLNRGLAYFELQGDGDSNHTKVRFGDTDVTASGFTVIRINVDKAPGEVAVFSGNAHLDGGSPALDVHGGESVVLSATDGYNVAETIEPDSWDAWNTDRDQAMNSEASNQTEATSSLPDSKNPAWSDLDSNGNWYDVPDQGYVWSPNEASNPDWDPYANGYWMSTPSYGYMWVSGYSWGYMPYQCGFWNFYSGFGWGWAPGACNPWWGGSGGWVVNIGFAPPRYHYPVRPRPRHPRPMDGHQPTPMPLIAVNRLAAEQGRNVFSAPRDKTGTVMIAGRTVNPLRPSPHPGGPTPTHPIPVFTGRPNPPAVTANPPRQSFQGGDSERRAVFQGGSSAPQPIAVPARPAPVFTPAPMPRSAPTYNPRPAPIYTPRPAPVYTPPPAPSRPIGGSAPHPAPPVRSSPSPAPAPSHVTGGGGRPSASPR